MPISSGFGYYPYHYPTTMTERVQRPQIVSRAPQFRNNQNGYNPKNPTKTKPPPPRPTAIKQSSPRSDTFLVSNRQNEANSKFSKVNGTRRAPLPAQHPPPPPPSDKKRTDSLQRKAPSRPAQKLLSPSSDQVDYGRKPVRFAQRNNPPAYQQRPAPSHPSDALDSSRRMRVTNDDYVIQRRRGPPPAEYIYDDGYRSDSPVVRSRSQRYVRVVRDAPYEEEDDDVYYVESPPVRRPAKVIRRPPPPQTTEYVYADEVPVRARSRRPEVVYVDDDRPVEYEDDYIYVDEHGNQVDIVNQRRKSPQYVEYIYEDELDRKRSQKPKVVYVDDDDYDDRRHHRPNPKNKSKYPSSTRIVYD